MLVDLVFRSSGDIYLDDEMLAHATELEVKGQTLRLVSPEDLAVIKAIATAEHSAHHWYDALAIIARHDLDWDYLLERARRHGPRRVLSLLLYAESNDLAVPADVVERLHCGGAHRMTEPSEYLAAQIRTRLAEGGLAQVAIDVRVADGRVVLAGCVESAAVRRRVCEAVQGLVADHVVCDELSVTDPTVPADHEDVS